MIDHGEHLLEQFRGPGRCELCGKLCQCREPHHWYARGLAGGAELHVRINLIALGGPWECFCHRLFHDGHIKRRDLLQAIAEREGLTADAVEREIYRLLRMPKERRWEE